MNNKKNTGRPVHKMWNQLNFQMIKTEKGQRSIALCTKCNKLLKNTAISRLSAHRNNCEGMKKQTSIVCLEEEDMGLEEEDMGQEEDIGQEEENGQEDWPVDDEEEKEESKPVSRVISRPVQSVQAATKVVQENKLNNVEPQQQKKYLPPTVKEVVKIQEPKVNRVPNPPRTKKIITESNATKIAPRQRATPAQETNSISSKVEINDALSGFLIGSNLNFDVADSRYFRNFLNKLAPDYEVPTGHELKMSLLKKLSGIQLDHVEEISDDDLPRGASSRRPEKRSQSNGDRGYKRKYETSSDDEVPLERYPERYARKGF